MDAFPEIFAVSPDGPRRTDVGRDPAKDVGAVPSPDGTKVLFCSARAAPDVENVPYEQASTLVVAGIDGRTLLTRPEGCLGKDWSWSPDSRRIVSEPTYGGADAVVVDVVSGFESALGHAQRLLWSPDGSRLVLLDAAGWYVAVPGSGRFLVAGGDFGQVWAWSPDGSRLLGSG